MGNAKTDGLSAGEVFQQLITTTDKLHNVMTTSIQAVTEVNGKIDTLDDKIDYLKTEQSDCLKLHADKTKLCSFADVNGVATQTLNQIVSELKNFKSEFRNFNNSQKTIRWLLIVLSFVIMVLCAIIGVKVAIPPI